ncbi:TonB-dependent copper receptor [Marinomonas sp. GJ51-6]|uniref:TonB-dependent copper receptor n=1 Tax=Marinomonas sp. GJ51-6 TaxID=2992802 RepID=UPI002934A7E5|nr:TonB-dependent copper receptor [Marinomonas sp. GJ51-6]WOD08372.1 TonB-dependent copper receptor [Marinomonas sp. GJ51-6]
MLFGGTGISAATVRFERKDEDFTEKSNRIEAEVMVGSYGRFDRRIEGALGNNTGYIRIEANESESDDYKDGNGDTVESAWRKWNASFAAGWTPDEDTLLELEISRGDGYSKYAGRSMDGTKFLRENLALRFEKENLSANWSKLEAQFNYGYADHIMDNYTLRDPGMMSMAMELDRLTRSGRIASTWDWDTISVVAGLDTQNEVHKAGISDTSDGYEDYSKEQLGGFFELTKFLANDDRIIMGYRFDHYNATDETTTTATAGETRQANLHSGFLRLESDLSNMPATAYIGIGHVERFPDYWEINPSYDSLAGGVNAFSTVDPEKTTQLDIGLNYQQGAISSWVSGYAGIVEDFIIFDYSSSTEVGNVDAYIAGFEMGARYQLTPEWSTNASLAYAWGQDTDNDEPLPQIAPLEAKLGATFEQDSWTTNTVLRMVASQNRISEDRGNVVGYDFGTSTGFATMDINLEYRINEHFTWRAGINNLMDKAYYEHLNKAGSSSFGYAADEAYLESGRTLWTSVNAKF